MRNADDGSSVTARDHESSDLQSHITPRTSVHVQNCFFYTLQEFIIRAFTTELSQYQDVMVLGVMFIIEFRRAQGPMGYMSSLGLMWGYDGLLVDPDKI